jgi:soluble lytic murein transglycosylase-like protein
VRSLAPRYRLDPNLVLAVVEVESNFNPKAVSPKNAQGLMQLIPATAERFGVRDVWDPEQNLHGGMAYLRWLLDYFKGDVKLALAGYNAGEKAVERHGGIPPYAETQAYVQKILRRIGGDEALRSG